MMKPVGSISEMKIKEETIIRENMETINGYTVVDRLDPAKWALFVRNHPRGNAFQTPELAEVYRLDAKHKPVLTALLDREGAIAGLVLAGLQEQFRGPAGKLTTRSVIYGTPLVRDDSPEILEILLDVYRRKIKKHAIYSQFRNLWPQDGQKEIFSKFGFQYEEHLDVLVDLTLDEDQLLSAMQKDRRKNIRRAEKLGVEFREVMESGLIAEGIGLVGGLYRRKKIPFPGEEFLGNVYRCMGMGPSGMARMFGAFYEGRLATAQVAQVYNGVIYNWWIGHLQEYEHTHANDFIQWRLMCWGRANGCRVLDLGGAGKPGEPYGVRDYKVKFGGRLVNFGRYEGVHNPLLMTLGKLGLRMLSRLK